MPPSAPPPLPLAANRAALSNRISLLLSAQSSILKSMNLSTRPSTITRPPIPDDDDLQNGARPNEGVGYVPDKKLAPVNNTKEDRFLRGRKGKDGGKSKKWKEESESEEEVGRSALGKRKRPRKEVADVEDAAEDVVEEKAGEFKTDVQVEGQAEDQEADTKMDDTPTEATETKDVEDSTGGDKKKRKRKTKKKKSKTKETSD